MKLKSLIQSKGEKSVKTILEYRVAKTPFQVAPKVRLASSIEWEPQKNGSHQEATRLFNYFTRAELDFLIFYRDSGLPILAVEFDGRYHETDAKARERDILKNRICSMAGLPLLRVRYHEIQPLFTCDSFLSYLIGIIVRYKTADEKKGYGPYDEIRRHDLRDLQMLQNRLAQRHRMIPSDRAAETSTARFAYEFGPPGITTSETDTKYKSHLVVYRAKRSHKPKEWPVAHRITKELTLRTHYRTIAELRPPDGSVLGVYGKWLEKEPLYANLPGVRWLYVAWNILEGLCLKQLLTDAEEHKFV